MQAAVRPHLPIAIINLAAEEGGCDCQPHLIQGHQCLLRAMMRALLVWLFLWAQQAVFLEVIWQITSESGSAYLESSR